jgi:carbon-monoxide dehydrogenase medium subunit
MHAFSYHKPSSLGDALSLAAKHTDGKILAGGQSLVQAMKLRLSSPTDIIDLSGVKELSSIKVEGSSIAIGAMTRHADVESNADVKKMIPALARLAGGIGDRQVRHMGTIGGSIANNDPAACYPAAVLGLGATITTNKRKIAGDDFFKGLFETALEPGELITAVTFPSAKRAGYIKFKNPASRFALVGVFVAETSSGVRVAVTGAASCVFRATAIEKALSDKFDPAAVPADTVKADTLNSDLHGSAEYRAHLITVMARRAVTQALGN